MSWAPNLERANTRAKTLKKIKEACGWAYATCRKNEQVISKEKIDAELGRSNQDLGNYLRNKLLVCTNSHTQFFEKNSDGSQNKGIAKIYTLNQDGYKELMSLLDGGKPVPADFIPTLSHGKTRECVESFFERANDKHSEEMATLQFNMHQTESCPRLIHGLQQMDKELKPLFWSDKLPFNYDIQSCAPTLLFQQAQQLGLTGTFDAMATLLVNPRAFREQLADRTGITYKQAKVIINALFCGATLGRSERFELFRLVGNSYDTMNKLRDDVWLTALREEIKAIWKVVADKGQISRRKNKKGHWMPLRCQAKWSYYFKLERMVLDEIIDYLKDQGVSYFPEHDGWRTSKEIDILAVEKQVSGALGFDIKIVQDTITKISEESLTSTLGNQLPDTSHCVPGVIGNSVLSVSGAPSYARSY